MSFFDKINYLIVNSIKEILKGPDLEESLPDSVQAGTFQKYVINSEWKTAKLTCWLIFACKQVQVRKASMTNS